MKDLQCPTILIQHKNDGRGFGATAGKRKAKALPLELSLLTDADRAKFDLVVEIGDTNFQEQGIGKEFLTAQSVHLQPTSTDQPEVIFDLKPLTVEQSRKLCANLGIHCQLWLSEQIQLPKGNREILQVSRCTGC